MLDYCNALGGLWEHVFVLDAFYDMPWVEGETILTRSDGVVPEVIMVVLEVPVP